MPDKTQELLNLKEQINNAEQDKSREEGKLQNLTETLNNKFECENTQQAQKKLDHWGEELDKKEKEYSNLMEGLKSEMEKFNV